MHGQMEDGGNAAIWKEKQCMRHEPQWVTAESSTEGFPRESWNRVQVIVVLTSMSWVSWMCSSNGCATTGGVKYGLSSTIDWILLHSPDHLLPVKWGEVERGLGVEIKYHYRIHLLLNDALCSSTYCGIYRNQCILQVLLKSMRWRNLSRGGLRPARADMPATTPEP